MLLDEIGAKLVSDGHATTSSTDDWFLVKGGLPDDVQASTWLVDKMVTLIETEGGPPNPRPGFQDAGFQLVVRGAAVTESSGGYTDARERAEQIYLDLHAFGSTTLSGVHYIGIWGEQNVFFGGFDHRQRPYFVCNYRALRSTTSS